MKTVTYKNKKSDNNDVHKNEKNMKQEESEKNHNEIDFYELYLL